ncbi:hypothetical protein [Carboxylicivirga sp. RSCT41]|uniref:hypothetical protein n=1 Tax=Carboxylicivirga agarovorans TaxID=3417570 RepID=UPI003D338C70
MLKQAQIDSTLVKRLEENLENAFKEKKIESLDSFLLDWVNRYDFKKKISDPIEHDVYEVFKTIYKRTNISKLEPSWGSDDFIQNYIVVQSSVPFFVKGWNYENIEDDNWPTIFDLKPNISDIHSSKLLYLTPEYELAIRKFIKNKEGYAYDEELFYQLENERIKFLKYRLIVNYGGYRFEDHIPYRFWHLVTHPKVQFIEFNKSRDSAQVFIYKYGDEYIVDLFRQDNTWTFVKSYLESVE